MKRRINNLLDGAKGDISVYCQVLDEYAPRYCHNAGFIMSSASTIKAPIMLAALELVAAGKLFLDKYIEVCELTGDSAVFETPRKASVLELLTWMIIDSDNTATNALIDLAGFDFINRYIQYDLEMTDTFLRRKMLDFESRAAGKDNMTTACDMFKCYKRLFDGDILTDSLCGVATWILRKQRDKKRLMRFIWEDVIIAHKTGGLDYLSHDCGVFSICGHQIYVGVFIQNAPDIDGDPRLIGQIGRIVFDEFEKSRISTILI
ncbi:MAG: class A beta-lactamase-related serine hydrolase [Clostridiales bacterium]|jgi:beta-lactamase class A|nr:class A beta-lactamase-related serine hydrolase [Clostridiales bacterium]